MSSPADSPAAGSEGAGSEGADLAAADRATAGSDGATGDAEAVRPAPSPTPSSSPHATTTTSRRAAVRRPAPGRAVHEPTARRAAARPMPPPCPEQRGSAVAGTIDPQAPEPGDGSAAGGRPG
ncbi:hypothetical protein GCM10010472_11160 [Pseudonocardia halophobica]|uniref:Uncharacterized protein n=1 Tax=Pseudonocardia halophobica TaxID=29401 RepID=A0A9W6L5M4_9PSEU|nr:hypothetical protein GCM10017577_46470 [Pseudonocardia halophobica]